MCPNFTFTIHGLASFSLPAYSVFACIGLLFMMLFLYAKTQQIGVSFLRFLLLVGAMAAGVGIGSKVLFALTQIPEFLKEPTLRNLGEIIWTSGFVFYGGLFGAILAVKLYAKVFRLNAESKMSQEELLMLVDEVQQDGSIDKNEGELLKNAIDFSEQQAQDILIHRVDLAALPITASITLLPRLQV